MIRSISLDDFRAWVEQLAGQMPQGARLARSRIPGNLAVLDPGGAYIGYADPIVGDVEIDPAAPLAQPE